MNRELLEKQVNIHKDLLEQISFGDRELYFLKKEHDEDSLRADYLEIIGKDKIGRVIDKMIKDKELRNLMLTNLHASLKRLRATKQGSDFKYNCIINKQDNLGIYEIITPEYIGFADEPIPDSFAESLSSQSIDFIKDFTKQIKSEISYIKYGNWHGNVNIKSEIISQVKKLAEIGEFTRNELVISDKVALIKDPYGEEKTRAFFSAWQLNIFFEQFVAKFVEKQIGNPCLLNRKLCILPNIDGGFKNGFLEIDVIGYNKSTDELIFIECKNGPLNESQISKFIGRTKIIESTYGIRLDKKIMVGTKYIDRFFKPLPRGTSIIDVNCFDNRDYRKNTCYANFLAFLKQS